MQIVMKNVFDWGHMVGDADREVLAAVRRNYKADTTTTKRSSHLPNA